MRFLLLAMLALAALPARAQTAGAQTAGAEECPMPPLDSALAMPPAAASSPSVPATLADVEAHLREVVAADGVHVVHLWAPWCGNSVRDLASGGWAALAARFPDATFSFVTVWNDGDAPGRAMLDGHGLAAPRVVEYVAAGSGSHADPAGRVRTFLGHPLGWIPSTWIFNRNGQLAFALNYGEMHEATLATLLDAAYGRW